MKRRNVLIAGAVALTGAGVGGWAATGRGTSARAVPQAAASTAPVRRTDLASREQLPGGVGYADERPIEHAGPAGLLTAAPAAGTVVERGRRLYEVDGRPVVLLYGGRPMWRDLAAGVTPGEDVRQLNQNLGSPASGNRFTGATATAVRRWQGWLGVPVTGRVTLGSVVFAPGPVRIGAVAVAIGGRVGGGPVLRVSSTRRVATMAMPQNRAGQLSAGTSVEVTLPNGQRVPGTVETIGQPADNGSVTVTVGVGEAAIAAPVQVVLTTAQRRGVLAVPVTALRATEEPGGFEVVDGETRRRVRVRPGLLDERAGLVEVTGDGLTEGMRVEVPSDGS